MWTMTIIANTSLFGVYPRSQVSVYSPIGPLVGFLMRRLISHCVMNFHAAIKSLKTSSHTTHGDGYIFSMLSMNVKTSLWLCLTAFLMRRLIICQSLI